MQTHTHNELAYALIAALLMRVYEYLHIVLIESL